MGTLKTWWNMLLSLLPIVQERDYLRLEFQRLSQQRDQLRDQMADKELQMQRLRVLLEAERSNKPHEPRTVKPRTAAELRRMVEHQNAEEMEQQEAV
jgi:hypothetical protein